MRDRIAIGAAICHLVFLAVGCARQPEPGFTSGAQAQKLKPEFQTANRKILSEQCGRPMAPKLVGSATCREAHSNAGPRSTPVTACSATESTETATAWPPTYMIPKPRNYLMGIFKFTSTNYGAKPLREDLMRTVRARDPGHVDAGVSRSCRPRTSRRSSITCWR